MTWILSKAFVNSLSSPEREEDSSQAGNAEKSRYYRCENRMHIHFGLLISASL